MISPRGVFLVAALGMLVLAIAMARQFAVGSAEMRLSDDAAATGDWASSIAHARAAAETAAPGNRSAAAGLQRLEALGHDAETRHDEALALSAYGAMRAAAIATRGPFSDGRTRARAEAGLSRAAGAAREAPPGADTAMARSLQGDEPVPILVRLALAAAAIVALAAIAISFGFVRAAWLAPLGDSHRGAHPVRALALAALVAYACLVLSR